MKIGPFSIFISLMLFAFSVGLISQEDNSHFSEVFSRDKLYRIFLPSDYQTQFKDYFPELVSHIDDERLYVDLQPEKWGDGYALSPVIHIAEDCPTGHQINRKISKNHPK